jgi:hypothetical protein
MFKIVLVLLSLTFMSSTIAEVHCENSGDGENFQKCVQLPPQNELTIATNPCPNRQEGQESVILENSGATLDTPLSCLQDDIYGDMNKKDTPNKQQVVKEYAKQCKRKAKAYKKAVFKKLLKKFKLGQAFQALVKSKKKISKSKINNGRKKKVGIDLTAAELEAMSQSELNSYILEKLNEKVPGLSEAVGKISSSQAGLSKGFHENETIPLNIVVEAKGKSGCTVNVDKVPERGTFIPKICKYCKGSDLKNSFVDDCSYMKSTSFSEKEALNIMDSSTRKKSNYCQSNMDTANSDMRDIDALTNKICDIAQNGLLPDFDIETTRNLYNDKTPNLAEKRGQFIQKYIQKKIQKDCQMEAVPEWLSNANQFASRIRVSHPNYEGNNTKGDYGPSPYANAQQQQDEIQNFEKTMKKEKLALKSKKDEATAQLTVKKEKVQILYREANILSEKYKQLKGQLESQTDIGKMNQLSAALSTVSNSIHDIYNSMDNIEQEKNDLQQQVIGYASRIQKYSESSIENKIKLLKSYYSEKNSNQNINKKEWDKKLFNDFKMVKISGRAVQDPGLPSIEDGLSPKVSIALNAMIKLDQFTCTMEPITTYKSKLSGSLKLLGKVGLAIASPVVLAGAGLATLAMAPITTTATLFCNGCQKPGKKMPRWMMIGNPFALDLRKGWPKRIKRDIKGGVETYFDLGGALRIRKTDKETTLHRLEDF